MVRDLQSLCETFAAESLKNVSAYTKQIVKHSVRFDDGSPVSYLTGIAIKQSGPERVFFGLFPKRKTLISVNLPDSVTNRIVSACYDSSIIKDWGQRLIDYCNQHGLDGADIELVK